MTIESAIFDTPTVLPVLNLYAPDEYGSFFERIWLEQHFKVLINNDLVPVVRTVADLAAAINRTLEDPEWYREGRAAIRVSILGPLDGRATERLAETILKAADNRRSIEDRALAQ